ncbi:hypothetical protein ABZ618_01925 [Streptomyces roseolus]|uniref:hypothetical protein n=1 Tax=Streptomyces roseolus TaxID=67358 RepID=UPI0033D4AF8D
MPPAPSLPDAWLRGAAAPALRDADTLTALLDDPVTAEGAAADPNLSARGLHELLDLAGVPRPRRPLAPLKSSTPQEGSS